MKKTGIFIAILMIPVASWGEKPLSDDSVRDLIISGDISSYKGDCPCPYSVDKNKNRCGDNSAYVVFPGTIRCYHGDITKDDVRFYRDSHQIPVPKLPWEKERKLY